MQWIFPPMWEYRPRGTYLYTKESVLGGFLANKMHRMHEEHVLDVLSITIILLVNPSLTVTASLIWGLWGLQMAGDAWSPQMAVSEPPWLLVNPTGPN